MQLSMSRRGVRVRVGCVLGVLAVSCATGVDVRDHVQLVEYGPDGVSSRVESPENTAGSVTAGSVTADPVTADPVTPEGATDGVQLSTSEAEGAGAELPLASGEMSEAEPTSEPERGSQSGDGAPSSSPPAAPGPVGDSEPTPPEDVPPVAADPEVNDPGVALDPMTQPAPVPGGSPQGSSGSGAPASPPSATDPELDPVPSLDPEAIPAVALPAAGPCLAGWEGSRCDTCSGQTQSDRLACSVYLDCYLVNACDPVNCGSLEQVCGVNRLGNGLAPKDIADAVYSCMCAP